MNKKFVAGCLVFCMFLGIPGVTYASSTSRNKSQTQKNLDEVNDQIDQLEGQQKVTLSGIDDAQNQINAITESQAQIQSDITSTQEQITQTQADLEVAREEATAEYESMKLRIQYMYENSTSQNFLSAIVESKSISEMLNRMEYVNEVYTTDREMLEAYEAKVDEVLELASSLDTKMTELTDLEASYEQEQIQLELTLVALQEEADKYADQIASAKALASQYEEKIRQQAAAAAAAAAAQSSGGSSSGGGSSYTGGSGVNPGQQTSVSGSDIVSYAKQFVGNPYVWGGNSLTNGCDCSGFVNLVLSHFPSIASKNTIPRYSLSFANYGQAVSSDCIQAGDVIVYSPKNGIGHVGIYDGNGHVVEAQSTNAGITANRAWNCREVIAIRRYH